MEKKFEKYQLTNIKWDTDGDEELAASLPKKMIVNVEEGMTDALDEAVNGASDIEGFCIISATVKKVKPNKKNGINYKAIVKEIEQKFEKYAIRPSYVAFVGNQLRVGLACIKGGKDKCFFNGEEHMKHLVDVADMIIFNVTNYTYDDNGKHVFGKVKHDRPKKVEGFDGNVMLITEFRCETK